MQDSQREHVYAAENTCSWWRRNYIADRKNDDEFPKVVAYVRRIVQSKWWQTRHPARQQVAVIKGRRGAYARGGLGGVSLPPFSWDKGVILHELAHVITYQRTSPSDWSGYVDPGHGRWFCATYLALVRRFLGKDAHDELRDAFRRMKVKYSKPRTRRALTPARRDQLRQQLTRAREAKAAAAALKTPVKVFEVHANMKFGPACCWRALLVLAKDEVHCEDLARSKLGKEFPESDIYSVRVRRARPGHGLMPRPLARL